MVTSSSPVVQVILNRIALLLQLTNNWRSRKHTIKSNIYGDISFLKAYFIFLTIFGL